MQVSVSVNANGGAGAMVGVAGYPVAATAAAAAAPSVPYGLSAIPYPLGYNYISGLSTSVSCINPQIPMQVWNWVCFILHYTVEQWLLTFFLAVTQKAVQIGDPFPHSSLIKKNFSIF